MSVLVLSESENEGEQLLDEFEDEAEVAPRLVDDRANVPVSVVTERFLRAILGKVPLDRIEELHLFSPLRQGTVETGIAVVAARVIIPEEIEPSVPLVLELAEGVTSDELDVPEALDAPEALNAPEVIDGSEKLEATDELEAPEAIDAPEAIEAIKEPAAHTSAPPRVRHTVYTARYRLIVKGPERGKWEMEVVDEADAPLLAVETVVQGVQRRAGEETATIRYDAAQLAHVLHLPLPK